jgi:hypothetical protein
VAFISSVFLFPPYAGSGYRPNNKQIRLCGKDMIETGDYKVSQIIEWLDG